MAVNFLLGHRLGAISTREEASSTPAPRRDCIQSEPENQSIKTSTTRAKPRAVSTTILGKSFGVYSHPGAVYLRQNEKWGKPEYSHQYPDLHNAV